MPRTSKRIAAVAIVVGLAAPAAAGAQPVAPAERVAAAQTVPADITDAEFLTAAAQSNRFEIATGQLARQRGESALVKRLGRIFFRHHTTALAQGSAVATKLGLPTPTALTAPQQSTVDRLARLRGAKFDRAWLKSQRTAHTDAVALHVRAALNGDTVDVRALAVTSLPIVASHLGQLTAPAPAHH